MPLPYLPPPTPHKYDIEMSDVHQAEKKYSHIAHLYHSLAVVHPKSTVQTHYLLGSIAKDTNFLEPSRNVSDEYNMTERLFTRPAC